jgi:hypothetical protein
MADWYYPSSPTNIIQANRGTNAVDANADVEMVSAPSSSLPNLSSSPMLTTIQTTMTASPNRKRNILNKNHTLDEVVQPEVEMGSDIVIEQQLPGIIVHDKKNTKRMAGCDMQDTREPFRVFQDTDDS